MYINLLFLITSQTEVLQVLRAAVQVINLVIVS